MSKAQQNSARERHVRNATGLLLHHLKQSSRDIAVVPATLGLLLFSGSLLLEAGDGIVQALGDAQEAGDLAPTIENLLSWAREH